MALEETQVMAQGGGGLELLRSDDPRALENKLVAMKTSLDIVKRFFRDVMVNGEDYGIIPGTQRPTLYKPGAEKLCELYGYAPTIRSINKDVDAKTGYLNVEVIVALVQKRTGIVIAEAPGSACTMESHYRYRWLTRNKIPKGINPDNLVSEERGTKDNRYTVYRLDNDAPWDLWNTVLKMAYKRAMVAATIAATRSSGVFTQDLEDMADYLGINIEELKPGKGGKPSGQQGQQDQQGQQGPKGVNWTPAWRQVSQLGLRNDDVLEAAKKEYDAPNARTIPEVPGMTPEKLIELATKVAAARKQGGQTPQSAKTSVPKPEQKTEQKPPAQE